MNMKSNNIDNNIEDIRSKFQNLLKHHSEDEQIKHDTQMLMYRFLNEIQKYQNIEGINRKKLAEAIKTSASYLTQLFRGNKPLNFETLAKIQKALNIKFEIIAYPKFKEIELFDETQFYEAIVKYKTPAGYWCYKNFENIDKIKEANTSKGQLPKNDSKKLVA